MIEKLTVLSSVGYKRMFFLVNIRVEFQYNTWPWAVKVVRPHAARRTDP